MPEHHDAEVRDLPPQREPEHLLRASEPDGHSRRQAALGIAIGGDARRLPGGVAVVEAPPSQDPVRIEPKSRYLDVGPECDAAHVGAASEHDEAGAVARVRRPGDHEP